MIQYMCGCDFEIIKLTINCADFLINIVDMGVVICARCDKRYG